MRSKPKELELLDIIYRRREIEKDNDCILIIRAQNAREIMPIKDKIRSIHYISEELFCPFFIFQVLYAAAYDSDFHSKENKIYSYSLKNKFDLWQYQEFEETLKLNKSFDKSKVEFLFNNYLKLGKSDDKEIR